MADHEIPILPQHHRECSAAADEQRSADMEGSALEKITGFKAFTFEELQSATDNFSPWKMLGEGSNGQVFHGLLRGKHVAVKRLLQNEWVEEAEKEEFIREIRHMGVVNHQNILSLMGFCLHAPTPLLVTERLHSLHKALYDAPTPLDWTTRFHIALGVAKGLAYLHTGARRPMLHCDIKPGNILLHPDDLTRAYIADFGVVHLLAHHHSAESGEEIEATWYYGTMGYWAPEVRAGKRLSTKSDVYSFGKLLYALVTGNENVHDMPASLIRKSEPSRGVRKWCRKFCTASKYLFLPWTRPRNNMIEATVAPAVVEQVSGCARALIEASTALRLIVLCTQDQAERRPSMERVRLELETATSCQIPWTVKAAVFVGIQRFRWASCFVMCGLITVFAIWTSIIDSELVGSGLACRVYEYGGLVLVLDVAIHLIANKLCGIVGLIYWTADEDLMLGWKPLVPLN